MIGKSIIKSPIRFYIDLGIWHLKVLSKNKVMGRKQVFKKGAIFAEDKITRIMKY